MRSLQVLRSSTLLPSIRRVDCTSEFREPAPWPAAGGVESSPESSAKKKKRGTKTVKQKPTSVLFCAILKRGFLSDWPDSACMRKALALASSSAVIHRCRSTSELAFRWYVCVPPLEMTKLHESSTAILAVARFMVPRHVWPISAWVLEEQRGWDKRMRLR